MVLLRFDLVTYFLTLCDLYAMAGYIGPISIIISNMNQIHHVIWKI